jgi:hypothetical protein
MVEAESVLFLIASKLFEGKDKECLLEDILFTNASMQLDNNFVDVNEAR